MPYQSNAIIPAITNQRQGNEQIQSKPLLQPRSSHGPSLKRKRSFTQAAGPRWGETTNRGVCWVREFSLRGALLSWARPPLAQRWGSSLGLKLQRHVKAPMSSRLGKPLSPKRDITSLKRELSARTRARVWTWPVSTSLAWARVSDLVTVLLTIAIFSYPNNNTRHSTFQQ